MPLQPVGTQAAQVLTFNSGVLTVNGYKMADVTDISITKKYAEKSFYALNSILKRAIRRASFEAQVSCTMYAFNKQVYATFFGSSSPVSTPTGNDFTVNDGQQAAVNVYLTCYPGDDTSNPVQYQLTNATFLSEDVDLKNEDFMTAKVTISCTNLTFNAATTQQN